MEDIKEKEAFLNQTRVITDPPKVVKVEKLEPATISVSPMEKKEVHRPSFSQASPMKILDEEDKSPYENIANALKHKRGTK